MKIYIDNEEVLCASKMTISESLKNTSSVILNNVYPKSWETNKDYVSNFYMPKDYSKCLIEGDEQPATERDYTDKVNIVYRRTITNDNEEAASADYSIVAIPVIPGQTYKIKLTSSGTNKIYETYSWNAATITPIQTLAEGESEITIIPNDRYLLMNHAYQDTTYVEVESITETTNLKEIDLSNNIHTIGNRFVDYSTSRIFYSKTNVCQYIPVIPNQYYYIKFENTFESTGRYLCQTDTLNIGTICNSITFMFSGEHEIIVKPTRKYIIISAGGTTGTIYLTGVSTIAESNIEFSGFIKNSGNINLNPRYPHYATLQLLDYKSFLSEGDTLNFVIDSMSALDTLKFIVKDLQGFALGDVKIPETNIVRYNCNEKTPYDVFEYIAEITGSIWYTQAINNDLVLINFYSTDNLEEKDNIEYTQDYFVNNSIQDIQYSYNAKDYRNKQIITSDGAKAEIPQTEYISYLGEELQTTYPIAEIESASSGSDEYTIGTEVAKSIGIYANVYYSYGSNRVEVNNVPLGKVIKIIYYPVVVSRQVSYNESEIDRISESTNRNGIIARYEKREDTRDEKALAQISQTYLDYKSVPEIILEVRTYYKDIYNIGDVVFFNGPLDSLKTKYLVIEKSIDMITTGNQQKIWYKYKLSSSFNDENAINYFDNQRRKLSGNIEEGEYISRYVDLPKQTNIIFYDLSVDQTLIPGDILDGELDIELLGNTNILNGILNLLL